MLVSIPPFIKKGALFGLVSPAGKIDAEKVSQAEKFLESQGFRSCRGETATGNHYQFSASDKERAADMQSMINNPDVDVIWCCRGGYGAMRIIDDIDFTRMKQSPKWIIGFSDITVFHAALQNVHNIISIHGPMPINLPSNNHPGIEWTHMLDLLQGHEVDYHVPPNPFNKEGTAAGELTGGNLSLLSMLTGTKYDFKPHGKILFIEDVGEQLYHLDRMMYSLKLSGKLESLAGLIVGHLTEMKNNSTPFGFSAQGIINEVVKDYDYPVLFDFPAGHHTQNEPLIMGAQIHLQVSEDGGFLVYP